MLRGKSTGVQGRSEGKGKGERKGKGRRGNALLVGKLKVGVAYLLLRPVDEFFIYFSTKSHYLIVHSRVTRAGCHIAVFWI